MTFEINSSAIPTPQTFITTTFDIKREARLSSGKLVTEVVATKLRFRMNYTNLNGVQLDALLTLLYADTFLTLTYPTETGSDTATVAISDVPRELWYNYGDKQLRNISIELVEQ